MRKNVYSVSGAVIWTHDHLILRLLLKLHDQGSRLLKFVYDINSKRVFSNNRRNIIIDGLNVAFLESFLARFEHPWTKESLKGYTL